MLESVPDRSGSLSPDLSELVGRQVGNYVLERPLARGGMAVVFVARHPDIGREVAVKFLRPQFQGDLRLHQRFLQEARVTATLRHPNIVEIFDFGELEGRSYYTMELLSGSDLAAQIKRHRRFTHEEVASYVSQICEALEAAHQVDVVHRDLKPANVFVLDDDPLRLKLMDFGIARVNDAPRGGGTLHGQILGTPTHMSPEQALGQLDRIGPQTDVYAVGVIAFEMLTGRLPFSSESDLVLMSMHIRDPVPRLREFSPDVPEEIAELIERCLSKSPEARPASARTFAEAFVAASRQGGRPRAASIDTSVASGALGAAGEEVRGDGSTPAFASRDPVVPAARPGSTDRKVRDRSPPVLRLRPEARSLPADSEPPSSTAELAEEPIRSGKIVLTHADGKVLDRLLLRMQRRADFPSFLTNVAEISRKADADSQYSACHLSDAILKDFALTAKLVRMVNTLYGNRFGGKVYSVNQAVVILGFDSVRSIAMGLSVFKIPGQVGLRRNRVAERSASVFDEQLADSAVSSLVSGEVARALAPRAGLKDAELAMMCAIFRNLGQHLVMEYLPEDYEKILALSNDGIPLHTACTRVLGTTLQKIALGVAERWSLPKQMQTAMSLTLGQDDKLEREEDRLSALAKLSNDLCDIVTSGNRTSWDASIDRLLARNRKLLTLDKKDVSALLGTVCKSFEKRYAALFGPYNRKSRFLQNARTLSGDERSESVPVAAPISVEERELAESRARALLEGLERRREPEALLREALHAMADALKMPRAVLLVLSEDRQSLLARCAVGDEAPGLLGQLKFPFTRRDAFSVAVRNGEAVVIEDALSTAAMRRVPQCYYEALGSPAFAAFPCVSRGYRSALLLVDAEHRDLLPRTDRIAATAKLRELTARIAERCV